MTARLTGDLSRGPSFEENTGDQRSHCRHAHPDPQRRPNRASSVNVVSNKLNRGIVKVLEEEGYINGSETIEDGRQG